MNHETQSIHVCDIADVIGDANFITVSVGSDLNPVVLSLQQPPDYRIEKQGASFAKKRASRPNRFSVHYPLDGEWRRLELEETTENYHSLQPLGREHWLLVRGRADGDEDQNAAVYDASGQRLWSFHAGDGIEHVQVTETGKIWIGYFDEGIFGDTNLGPSGLACLDDHGHILFRYDSLCGPKGLPFIADCYAMNVCSAQETWLYYYTDFPLVRLVDAKPAEVWRNVPKSGSHAFAVGRGQVLPCGSYRERNTLFLLDLGSMSLQKITPLDEFGHPLKGFRGIGRRTRLFLFTPTSLYYLDINSLSGT